MDPSEPASLPLVPPLLLQVAGVSDVFVRAAEAAGGTDVSPGRVDAMIEKYSRHFGIVVYQISGNVGRRVAKIKAVPGNAEKDTPGFLETSHNKEDGTVEEVVEEENEENENEKLTATNGAIRTMNTAQGARKTESPIFLRGEKDVHVCPLMGTSFRVELHNRAFLHRFLSGNQSAGGSTGSLIGYTLVSMDLLNYELNKIVRYKLVVSSQLTSLIPRLSSYIYMDIGLYSTSMPVSLPISDGTKPIQSTSSEDKKGDENSITDEENHFNSEKNKEENGKENQSEYYYYANDLKTHKQREIKVDVSTTSSMDEEMICYFEPCGEDLKMPRIILPGAPTEQIKFLSSQLSSGDIVELDDIEDNLNSRLQLQGMLLDGEKGEVVEYCDVNNPDQITMKHSGESWVLTPGGSISKAITVYPLFPLLYRRADIENKLHEKNKAWSRHESDVDGIFGTIGVPDTNAVQPPLSPTSPTSGTSMSGNNSLNMSFFSPYSQNRETLAIKLLKILASSKLHDIGEKSSAIKMKRKDRIKKYLGRSPMSIMDSILNESVVCDPNIESDNFKNTDDKTTTVEAGYRNFKAMLSLSDLTKSVMLLGAFPTTMKDIFKHSETCQEKVVKGNIVLAKVVRDKTFNMMMISKEKRTQYSVNEEGYKLDVITSAPISYMYKDNEVIADIGLYCVFDGVSNKITVQQLPPIHIVQNSQTCDEQKCNCGSITSLLEIIPEIRGKLEYLRNNLIQSGGESHTENEDIKKEDETSNSLEKNELEKCIEIQYPEVKNVTDNNSEHYGSRMTSIGDFIKIPVQHLLKLVPKDPIELEQLGDQQEGIRKKKKKSKKTKKAGKKTAINSVGSGSPDINDELPSPLSKDNQIDNKSPRSPLTQTSPHSPSSPNSPYSPIGEELQLPQCYTDYELDIKVRIMWSGKYNYDLSAVVYDDELNELELCNSARKVCLKPVSSEHNALILATPKSFQESQKYYLSHCGMTSVVKVVGESTKVQTLNMNFKGISRSIKYIVPVITLSEQSLKNSQEENDLRKKQDVVEDERTLTVELLCGDSVLSVKRLPVSKDIPVYVQYVLVNNDYHKCNNNNNNNNNNANNNETPEENALSPTLLESGTKNPVDNNEVDINSCNSNDNNNNSNVNGVCDGEAMITTASSWVLVSTSSMSHGAYPNKPLTNVGCIVRDLSFQGII